MTVNEEAASPAYLRSPVGRLASWVAQAVRRAAVRRALRAERIQRARDSGAAERAQADRSTAFERRYGGGARW